jgi:hypothetical protein
MARQVKFFYDTEFLEDGYTVDLISIGMVNYDTGDTFYAVSSEFDTRRVVRNRWLMDNVMSSIDHKVEIAYTTGTGVVIPDMIVTDPALMTRRQIRDGIMEFTRNAWPEFWAWYGAYDHVALCQLFGPMVDLPGKFPMFTMDLKMLHKQAGNPPMPQQPNGLHNALDDAKFNVVRYDYLKGLTDGERNTSAVATQKG